MVYPGGPGTKITSVSTGNLCADVSDLCGVISGVCVLNAPAGQLTLRWGEESPTRCPSRRDDELFLWSGDIQTGCRRLLFWKAFNEPFRCRFYFFFFDPPGRALASPSGGLPHPHPDVPQGLLHHTSFKESRPRRRPRAGALSALAGNGGQRAPPRGRQHPQQHAGRRSRTKRPSRRSLPRSTCSAVLSPQRVNHSQEDLYPPAGGMRPEDLMQQHYQQDYPHRELDYQHRDMDYQRGLPGRIRRTGEFEAEMARTIL